MTSLAAWKTGLPVKMVYSREECLQTTTKRHPCTITYTHAVRGDGKILGVKADILLDAGAYSGYSPSVLGRSVVHAVGPYTVEHVLVAGKAVFTNNPSSGAMRGYGTPQLCFGHESQMDQIAEQLDLDPWEVRLKNALKPGDSTATGQIMREDIKFTETILAAREKMRALPQASSSSRIKTGWGVACFWYGNGRTGLPNPGIAHAEMNQDGSITVYVGSPDIGQGSNTLFRQVAAEVLHLSPEKIFVVSGDTLLTEDSGTTSGTRLTFIVANGVKKAAEDLLKRINDFQKEAGLTGSLPQLISKIGSLAGEKGVVLRGEGHFDPPTVPPDAETGQGIPYGSYTFGTQYVELGVNLRTGRVLVDRIVASYDCGVVVNPLLFKGQVDGGAAQGVGYALLEELSLNKGKVNNDNFNRYLMATSLDVSPVDLHTVSSYDQLGPFGAKGIGEPATIPTTAAVISAINRASGSRFKKLPVIPETIVAAGAGRWNSHGRS
jgi:CO/xanthine dehydrogenase Mo-binding subunit